MAAQLERLERVSGPVFASSWVLAGGVGLFAVRVFGRTSVLVVVALGKGPDWEALAEGRPGGAA